ncbi:hypothetical protein EYF80_061056 [Liparis tanakae]|uniref:Uncharacterized protein n=1 Tax=Liparis tanakae TaxID=230148 RepID=A0A4Z2EIW0_9TELE|nr:hypothetical protein EYF80_061056 [Liparis tanakae]
MWRRCICATSRAAGRLASRLSPLVSRLSGLTHISGPQM